MYIYENTAKPFIAMKLIVKERISFSNIVCIVISEFQSEKKEKNLFDTKRGFDIDNHTIFKLEYNEN